jgi:hypothetical protein
VARELRVEYPRAIYHVMNRGDRREPIFAFESGARQTAESGAVVQRLCVEQMEQGVGNPHRWDAKRDTDAQKAESIVAEELRQRRWTEGTLKERRRTDPAKIKLAQRLRQETVRTLHWIAQRLQMVCRHTLASCLRASRVSNSRD